MALPLILYDSLLESADAVTIVSPDTEVSGTHVEHCLDRLPFTRWGIESPDGDWLIHVDMGSGGEQAATAIALTGHSLDTDVGGGGFTIKVRYSDFTTITRSHSAPPTRKESKIVSRAVQLLERTEAERRPVRLIGVSVHNLCCESDLGTENRLPFEDGP